MINEENKIDERYAIIFYKFIECYHDFEKQLKSLFILGFDDMSYEVKSRCFHYIGFLKSTNRIVDYDSYSTKFECKEFTGKKLLNDLTLIQMMKIARKDRLFLTFEKGIDSYQNRITFDLYDACISIINSRNKLAHEFNKLHIKDADTVELLSKEAFYRVANGWQKEMQYESLDENFQRLMCNHIYMKRIMNVLSEKDNSDM